MDAPATLRRLAADMPDSVRTTLAAVAAADGRAWLVGGAIRDALLGRDVQDFDFATDLRPDRLLRLFPDADARDARLGTLQITVPGHRLVFTTLRVEGDYRDQRHPEFVRFVDDPIEDALRRDFTINAIYANATDLARGGGSTTFAVLDPTGGLDDLRHGVLRVIGDPSRRFVEDPLRILRAVRFAANGRATLDPSTELALRAALPGLATLPPERVRDELTAAFVGPGRGRALRLLVDLGIADRVLPEIVPMVGVPQPAQYHPEGDVLTHVCLVLAFATPTPIQAWSAVLHDVGKPQTFVRADDRIRFHGHDEVSATMAASILSRLHASRDLREAVVDVCREHIRIASVTGMARPKRERFLRGPRIREHLDFHRADCLGSHGKLDLHAAMTRELEDLPPIPPPPLCSGADVLALGIPPGPRVGALLRRLQSRIDDEEVADRVAALDILARLVAEDVKG